MLIIHIDKTELYNPNTREIIPIDECTLKLEHSLVSISAWESKWHVPFLSDREQSPEEILDYIRCMNEDQNISTDVLSCLTDADIQKIVDYIKDSRSATVIADDSNKPKKKKPDPVTSEEIYANMTVLRIPYECQYWHLNRLINLIELTNRKNEPPKKMSNKERISKWDAINEARKKKYHSKG